MVTTKRSTGKTKSIKTAEKKVVKKNTTKKNSYDELPDELSDSGKAFYKMVRDTLLDSAYNKYEDLSKITPREVMIGTDAFISKHGNLRTGDDIEQFKSDMEALIRFLVLIYAPNAYDGFFEEGLKEEIDKKANESELGNVAKAFDYIGFIFIIGAIICCFKVGGFGTLAGIYLIWWVISVIRSVCKNTDVAKNTSSLLNSILKAKDMLRKGEDKDSILKALSLKDIMSKNK